MEMNIQYRNDYGLTWVPYWVVLYRIGYFWDMRGVMS